MQESLDQIQKEEGVIGSFIHIHPPSTGDTNIDSLFPETDKQIVKSIFFLAKHLSPLLTQSASSGRSCFCVMTQLNGNLGFGAPQHQSSLPGGLYGLVKTANIEWGDVFCRAIDLAPEFDAVDAAEVLENELLDPDQRITEVGYNSGGRLTLTTLTENTDTEVSAKSNVDSRSLFLVAGGAKGVTAACVRELAHRHRCKFILLGRTKFPIVEPVWLQGVTDETELKRLTMEQIKKEGERPTPVKITSFLRPILAQREVKETLASISNEGAQVEYLSCDIFDRDQLSMLLKPLQEAWGPITGIIHGAGVLADKLIAEKTEADYDTVVSTKIDGLRSMLGCIQPEHLKHLVLFSSAAGFYGNEAQADYALANEVLNKFAHQFQALHPDCHVISFNWGPWDGGMVTPELKRLFEERQVKVIPIDVGSNIMANELSPEHSAVSQVVVGSSMVVPKPLAETLKTVSIKRTLGSEQNPFLSSHIIGKDPVLPIISALSWMADTCEQLYPGYRFVSCENTSVLKGIVFKDTESSDYTVRVKETDIRSSDDLVLDVNVSSLSGENKTIYHYKSLVTLSGSEQEIPSYPNANLVETDPKEGAEFYRDGTLFHGPLFQSVVRQLNIDKKRLTLLCKSPEVTGSDCGQFPPNPFNAFADDTQLQALLIWVRQFYQSASLPLKISRGEFYQKIPFDTPFYITLEVETVIDTKLTANTIAHDENGRIYSKLVGAEAIISKALDGKFLV